MPRTKRFAGLGFQRGLLLGLVTAPGKGLASQWPRVPWAGARPCSSSLGSASTSGSWLLAGLCPRGPGPTVGGGGAIRAGAPGLANWVRGLLLGVWTPGYSGTGAWQSARGQYPDSCPSSRGPRPQLALESLLLGGWQLLAPRRPGREGLVASRSHPNHAGCSLTPSPTPRCGRKLQPSSVVPLFLHSVTTPEQWPAPALVRR